jgi:hypothetical protein
VGGIDLKKSLQSAVDYKGLEYSEAELAKLPKAEAEYRRELMRRSKEAPPPPRTKWTRRVSHPVLIGHAKQEIKMEMGFETALKGGIEMYQKLMGRSKGAEGGDKISDVPEYVAKIPVPPRPRGLRVARAATCCPPVACLRISIRGQRWVAAPSPVASLARAARVLGLSAARARGCRQRASCSSASRGRR